MPESKESCTDKFCSVTLLLLLLWNLLCRSRLLLKLMHAGNGKSCKISIFLHFVQMVMNNLSIYGQHIRAGILHHDDVHAHLLKQLPRTPSFDEISNFSRQERHTSCSLRILSVRKQLACQAQLCWIDSSWLKNWNLPSSKKGLNASTSSLFKAHNDFMHTVSLFTAFALRCCSVRNYWWGLLRVV